MIYIWAFLVVSILCVSGYIGQVLGWASAISSLIGMIILTAMIYYFTSGLPAEMKLSLAFSCFWPLHVG